MEGGRERGAWGGLRTFSRITSGHDTPAIVEYSVRGSIFRFLFVISKVAMEAASWEAADMDRSARPARTRFF